MRLTIYDKVGVVQDSIALPVQGAEIERFAISNLPAGIDPFSFCYVFNPEDSVRVVQQTWLPPVISAEMSSFIGRTVRFKKDNEEIQGVLLRVDPVVIRISAGEMMVNPEGDFDYAADDLVQSLHLWVTAKKPGLYQGEMTYNVLNIRWLSHYVARIHGNNQIDLSGWVTIFNQSGIDKEVDEVRVVGDIAPQQQAAYTLSHPIYLLNNTDINISTLNVRCQGYRRYVLPVNSSEVEERVFIPNDVSNNLGVALPPGLCRTHLAADDGAEYIVGDSLIGPLEEEIDICLPLSNATDVVSAQKWVGENGFSNVSLGNLTDEPISVIVEEMGPPAIISDNTAPFILQANGLYAMMVEIAPRGSIMLVYRITHPRPEGELVLPQIHDRTPSIPSRGE